MASRIITRAASPMMGKIMEHNTLSVLKMPGGPAAAFLMKYRDAPVYSLTSRAWLDSNTSFHPLAPVFQQRFAKRTDTFWWYTITYKSVRAPRVIRSHMNRKMRHALTESLRKKGYGPDGSRLPGAEAEPPLTGTAHISPLEALLKTKMEDLISQTDRAVEGMLRSRRTDQVGPPRPNKPNENLVKKAKRDKASCTVTKYRN